MGDQLPGLQVPWCRRINPPWAFPCWGFSQLEEDAHALSRGSTEEQKGCVPAQGSGTQLIILGISSGKRGRAGAGDAVDHRRSYTV